MSLATNNLRDHQQQLDEEGIFVRVSRQAIEETLEQHRDMLAALKKAREYVVRVDGTMSFTAPENRLTRQDLDLIDAAIAKAEP